MFESLIATHRRLSGDDRRAFKERVKLIPQCLSQLKQRKTNISVTNAVAYIQANYINGQETLDYNIFSIDLTNLVKEFEQLMTQQDDLLCDLQNFVIKQAPLSVKKGQFTPEQSERLKQLMSQGKQPMFTEISAVLNREFGTSFTGKQISQRWWRADRPGLSKGFFSSEEDDTIR